MVETGEDPVEQVPSTSSDGAAEKPKSPFKKPVTKKRKMDPVELEMISALREPVNRHLSFFKGLLPSLEDFNEIDTIDFQMEVLKIVKNIRERKCQQQTQPVHNRHPPLCSSSVSQLQTEPQISAGATENESNTHRTESKRISVKRTLLEDYPKSNSRKVDVQQWLREKNIDFSPVETLDELRAKVKLAMPRGKIYKLDQLTHQMGHEVVRLPPYHCQYNPIELIWAQFKGRVAEKNSTFKIADVEALVHKEIDAVTADDWAKCGEHCVKIQEEDFYKAGLRDEILEPIILTIYPDDSSSSDDE
ncbi:hypothetical protein QTP88_029529 [Uroleucon formosanum]